MYFHVQYKFLTTFELLIVQFNLGKMKKLLLSVHVLLFAAMFSVAQTPLSMNGRLKLVGNQLSNQCGTAVQLRGMSSHAIMPHQNCITESSIKSLAKEWGSDLIRIAVYTEAVGVTPGYQSDSVRWNNYIAQIVDYAEANGIYVLIDWHVLDDQNPNKYVDAAKRFFATQSRRFSKKRNVLYEICNEPNGGGNWSEVKRYAETIIPIIRKNDKEGIIIVGTPEFSARPSEVWGNPLSSNLTYNVMYAFHFYAGSHTTDYRNRLTEAAGKIPMFVTEWGTSSYSGDGSYNSGESTTWINLMKDKKISWANWAFVDKGEVSSALKPDACAKEAWLDRSTSGDLLFNTLKTGDQFTQCAGAGDDDGDGVINSDDKCANTVKGDYVDENGCKAQTTDIDKDGVIDQKDICPNTPSGTQVNAHGCPIDLNFVSNACMGFNNYQGFARTDFTVDSLANMEYWNRPREKNPVYSSTTKDGKLVVTVTNADPDYKITGFSFGEMLYQVGGKLDTVLVPLDVRKYPVVKFNVKATTKPGFSYDDTDILLDVVLEDFFGNEVNTDATLKLHRKIVDLGVQTNIEANFTNGARESYATADCGTTKPPCYIKKFDFSKVTKVKVTVNPGAGEDWSRPLFTGTVLIDDFSIGFDATAAAAVAANNCDKVRDDDKDGIVQEMDTCNGTQPGSGPVSTRGCAANQLDDDKDGVTNDLDKCPNTPAKTEVDATGCTKVTGLADETSFSVAVYPVPATNQLTIDQKTLVFNKAVLMDITGNTLQEVKLSGSKEVVSVEGLPKGIYLIQMTGAEKSELLRFIVQ